METVISNTNRELDDKIKNSVKPEHEDKKRLQNRIKQLDKQQQLHLFHTIIKPLDIYTVSDNGTFFDLNELTEEQFWKLNYQVNLTYDCIKRDKVINELEQEQEQSNRLYNHEYDIESASANIEIANDLEVDDPMLNWGSAPPKEELPITFDNRIGANMTYSQLRDASLNECRYSKREGTFNSSILTNDFESKVLERNVYTDKRGGPSIIPSTSARKASS